ncbi:MAG: cytochrome C oxidase subunit IV family protein [Gemmatimonadales bacterium]
MDAHAAHGHAEDHAHPTPGLYLRIAIILFVLTALEVAAFEVGRNAGAPLHALIEPIVVEILLVLSAAKFALVAMFYMHLKQDSKIFTNFFVWPLVIAAGVILALIILHEYWIKTTF